MTSNSCVFSGFTWAVSLTCSHPPAGPGWRPRPGGVEGPLPAWRCLSVVLEEKLFVVDSLYL